MVPVKFHSIRKKYSRTIITYITEHWLSINIYKQKIYEHRCYYFFSLYKRINRCTRETSRKIFHRIASRHCRSISTTKSSDDKSWKVNNPNWNEAFLFYAVDSFFETSPLCKIKIHLFPRHVASLEEITVRGYERKDITGNAGNRNRHVAAREEKR